MNIYPVCAPVPAPIETLRKRADFLAAARGRRVKTPGFFLQIRSRSDTDAPRIGFTCSKKVGNAVVRNRAKRRLRALAHLVLPEHAAAGHDYVLIGRATGTVSHPFAAMCVDLRRALAR